MYDLLIAVGTTTVADATKDIFTLVGKTIETITGQPILLAYFAAGLIGVSVAIIRKLKH